MAGLCRVFCLKYILCGILLALAVKGNVTITRGKCEEQVVILYTGPINDWRNRSGIILLSETHTVGNCTYHSTGRITPVSCQGEISLQLNLTNVTCVQNENITITAVINKYSIGASLKVTLYDTEYTYVFALEDSSCDSNISITDSVDGGVTISVDPHTCDEWKDSHYLEYSVVLMDGDNSSTVEYHSNSAGDLKHMFKNLLPGRRYECLVRFRNGCGQYTILGKERFNVRGQSSRPGETPGHSGANGLTAVWIWVIPFVGAKMCH